MLLVICCRGDKVERWGVELNFNLNKFNLPNGFIAVMSSNDSLRTYRDLFCGTFQSFWKRRLDSIDTFIFITRDFNFSPQLFRLRSQSLKNVEIRHYLYIFTSSKHRIKLKDAVFTCLMVLMRADFCASVISSSLRTSSLSTHSLNLLYEARWG